MSIWRWRSSDEADVVMTAISTVLLATLLFLAFPICR